MTIREIFFGAVRPRLRSFYPFSTSLLIDYSSGNIQLKVRHRVTLNYSPFETVPIDSLRKKFSSLLEIWIFRLPPKEIKSKHACWQKNKILQLASIFRLGKPFRLVRKGSLTMALSFEPTRELVHPLRIQVVHGKWSVSFNTKGIQIP